MLDVSKCDERIVKVAENNVEVRRFLYDKDGKEVFLKDKTESYGSDKIRVDLASVEQEIDKWEETDAETYKQEIISNLQKRKTMLVAVNNAMAGAIEPEI